LLFLSNIGVDVTPLLAGASIGGIAIAFALQNVLTDVFASFSIYFDKPFRVGDFITVGADSGTVKRIGIKTTRLQSLQGEELIISNKQLTESRINNFKRMDKRRGVFTFGVIYQTEIKKLEKIPKIITDIITKNKTAELDRVHFKSFGDSSLDYEVVYYVKSSDYRVFMDIQQEINLEIIHQFQKEGIEFAYPTKTVFLQK
jgi:small-conductance mechanosensitive channel